MKKLFRIIKFKSKPILVAKKLTKSFNKRVVLNQINFNLNRGEIFGILGPNGSGKTTLFNLILGIHSLDSGKIMINGETINSYPIHYRCANFKIAYVPQNSACLLGLSVESNLESICEIKIKDKVKRKEITQELLSRFGLDAVKHSLAYSLSGGERRRLSISMALVEAINTAQTEYNQCVNRQNKLLESLKEKRSDKLKKQLQENASILNLVEMWKEEESRKQLIQLTELRKKTLKSEIEKLSGMDEVKARIMGLTDDEALN